MQVEASRKPSRNRPGELMFWDKFRDTSRWVPAHGYGNAVQIDPPAPILDEEDFHQTQAIEQPAATGPRKKGSLKSRNAG